MMCFKFLVSRITPWVIERFNQTLKRKIWATIQESEIPQDRHGVLLTFRKLINEYNTTKHSTIGYPPMIVHFTTDKTVLDSVRKRIESILERNKDRYETEFTVGDVVRVLVWDDPTKTPAERNKIEQKFRMKKFPGAYWTKTHFTITKILHQPQFTQYILTGRPPSRESYPKQRFRTDQIQKVHF